MLYVMLASLTSNCLLSILVLTKCDDMISILNIHVLHISWIWIWCNYNLRDYKGNYTVNHYIVYCVMNTYVYLYFICLNLYAKKESRLPFWLYIKRSRHRPMPAVYRVFTLWYLHCCFRAHTRQPWSVDWSWVSRRWEWQQHIHQHLQMNWLYQGHQFNVLWFL